MTMKLTEREPTNKIVWACKGTFSIAESLRRAHDASDDGGLLKALLAVVRAGDVLRVACQIYRKEHDLHGDGTRAAGYAWDTMRHAEEAFGEVLAALRAHPKADEILKGDG